jgi:hypothetical protein
VEDLKFRLEINTEKIELFLQLISSLQAAVPTNIGGATFRPAPTNDIGASKQMSGRNPTQPPTVKMQ